MIKLNNTPKKLFSTGFTAIKFKYIVGKDYDEDPVVWVLSLLDKDEYYAQFGNIIFIRNSSIESMVRLRYPDKIEYICRSRSEFNKYTQNY